MLRKYRVIHLLHIRALYEIIDHLLRILPVTLQTKGQGLCSLQKEECIERRNCSSLIAENDCPDISNKSCLSGCLHERNTVIGFIRLRKLRKQLACCPVEGSAVHNDAAECCSVAANELGCRVNHDISTKLDRPDQIRSAEGIVNDKRKSVAVCNLCNGFNVRNVRIRIRQRLDVDSSCVLVNCVLNFLQISGIDELRLYSVIRKRMLQQVIGSSVDGLLRDDVLSCMRQGHDRIGNRSGSGSNSQSADAALQCSDSLLQNVLCGVGQSSIDVSGIAKCEAVGCMLCIVENIRGCLVNRNGSGIGCRIGLFLSYVKLFGFKFEFMLAHSLLSFPS